jgi:hypothetical protein
MEGVERGQSMVAGYLVRLLNEGVKIIDPVGDAGEERLVELRLFGPLVIDRLG